MKFYTFESENIGLPEFDFDNVDKVTLASMKIIKISKEDELPLKEILKQKSYIDRLVGFCVDDDLSRPVSTDEQGGLFDGNVGLIFRSPHKYRSIYTMNGFSAPIDCLKQLESLNETKYNRDRLFELAHFFSESKPEMRHPTMQSYLNTTYRLFRDASSNLTKVKMTMLIRSHATERSVLSSDLSEEDKNKIRVKFKPIPDFYNSSENIEEIKHCSLTFFVNSNQPVTDGNTSQKSAVDTPLHSADKVSRSVFSEK